MDEENKFTSFLALNSFRGEAIYNLLTRKGIITKEEFKQEMMTLSERAEDEKAKMEMQKLINENY